MIPIQCPAGSPRKKGLLREVGEEEGERPPPVARVPGECRVVHALTPLAPGKHRDPKAQPWILGRPAFLRP